MSYESTNYLGDGAVLTHVIEVIELLGYKKSPDSLKIENRVGSYFWHEDNDYKSYVGVELDVYRKKNRGVEVTTRSRMSRSYWDLVHQNRTIKMLRDLFGGYFITDVGRNRYMRPEDAPDPPEASGCYLARWRFNNALIKPRLYLRQRGLDQPNTVTTGMIFLDEMNPRLFSNNLLLPYLVAVWEEYFRSSFIALLSNSSQREAALKRANLNHFQLESIAVKRQTVEEALAESLSFQRPSIISRNFRLIDSNLDIGGALKKPYKRRKKSLYESIEHVVENRNIFVHTGYVNIDLTDNTLETLLDDIEAAVERCYQLFAQFFNFKANRGLW